MWGAKCHLTGQIFTVPANSPEHQCREREDWAKADQSSTEMPGPKSWGLRASFNTEPRTRFVSLAPYSNRAFYFHFLGPPRARVLQGEGLRALFIPLNSELLADLSPSSQRDYRVAEFLWRFARSPAERKLDSWRPTGPSLLIASSETRGPSRNHGRKKHTETFFCSSVSKAASWGRAGGNFH